MIDRIDMEAGGAWGILVRHAERDEITDESLFLQAQLTDAGREAARLLGLQAADLPLHRVYTSPVDRCVDTGASFLVGTGVDPGEATRQVVKEQRLFDAFVDDPVKVRETFSRGTAEERIIEFLREGTLSGLRPVAVGSRMILDRILSVLQPGTLTVFVSHDALIMPFLQHYTERTFELSRWLGFLDGAVIHASADRVLVDGHPVRSIET